MRTASSERPEEGEKSGAVIWWRALPSCMGSSAQLRALKWHAPARGARCHLRTRVDVRRAALAIT